MKIATKRNLQNASMEELVHDIVDNNRQIKHLLGWPVKQTYPTKESRYKSVLPEFDASMDTERIIATLLGEEEPTDPPAAQDTRLFHVPATNKGQKNQSQSVAEIPKIDLRHIYNPTISK